MKKRIWIILAIVFLTLSVIAYYTFLFVQDSEYSSQEQDEYYENYWKDFTFFEPLDTAFILGFQSEYYEIRDSELNYEPYSSDKYSIPYYDSIISIHESNNYDWAGIEIEKIGKIDKTVILKYEKKDSIEAFIYESYEYEEFTFSGESPGIWIGYSENNGEDWNYYYTGITQEQPVYVKHYSQRPLIKEKGKLEIDACLLRQLSPFSHPIPSVSYECVKDGLYLVLDMNVIAKDSDGDGLTDIVEDKFFTDKYNEDTDGDGIPDNLDMNPRVNYPRTKKSKIYEMILNGDIGNKNMDWTLGRLFFKGNNTIHHFTDSIETVDIMIDDKGKKQRFAYMIPTETVLIVTDDNDLMGIQPKNYRVIFMTTEEYKNNVKSYHSELNKILLSPFFKIDGKRNAYLVSCFIGTGSHKYLIQKMIIGWRIRLLSIMIS
jgi:hypothetical protein